MRTAYVHLDDTRAVDGERRAVLELAGHERRLVTFRRLDGPLDPAAGADPFLLATLLFCMQQGAAVHVHGPVTRRLLAGLEEWQTAWSVWEPGRYRRVPMGADEIVEGAPAAGPGLCVFSGGVDAAFAVHRHLRGTAGWDRVDLRAAVLVHGFDIDRDRADVFASAHARAERLLAGTGLELRAVWTDYRALDGQLWNEAHGLGLAAVMALFAGECSVGLIGSSDRYDAEFMPWGSSPMTDHLLSTGRMDIRHEGAGFGRGEKVATLAREWPESIEHLRVCWAGPEQDRNCGRCEKCVRTALAFRACGVAAPACFDHLPTDDEIRALVVDEATLIELHDLRAYVGREGVTGSWVDALHDAYARNEARLHPERAPARPARRRRWLSGR